MTDIDAVLFDLDDTLVRYVRSPGEVLRASYERLDLDPLFPVDAYYDRYTEFAEQYDAMDDLRSECFATLAEERGYDPDLGREVATTFAEERDQSNVELCPGAEAALDGLAGEYRLAVITNGAPDAQRAKMDAVDLDRWIETQVIAGHDVPPKPDAEPFEIVLDSLDATPERAVKVGDSLETDIAGANALGIESVWLSADRDVQAHEPTYRIDGLDELPTLLGLAVRERRKNRVAAVYRSKRSARMTWVHASTKSSTSCSSPSSDA